VIFYKNQKEFTATMFASDGVGIALFPRDEDDGDMHVSMEIIVEDDGRWFASDDMSSAHIEALFDALEMATRWLKRNAKPDISEHDGKQYGWKL